jgi:AhpD family alkylhydroperoxidase
MNYFIDKEVVSIVCSSIVIYISIEVYEMEKTERFGKIERIIQDFNHVHNEYSSRKSKVYTSFLRLMGEVSQDGDLTKKHKELMAVGIALVLYCEHCLFYHVNEALKSGATEQEILEAVHVAIEMGGGPVVIRSSFVFDILEYLRTCGSVTV